MAEKKRSSLTVRLPEQHRSWVQERAEADCVSMNDIFIRLIREARAAAVGQGVESSPAAAE